VLLADPLSSAAVTTILFNILIALMTNVYQEVRNLALFAGWVAPAPWVSP
jgi:hypothetical protein